ncbi:MAG TPA: T9SS type A sorting domain-containing protein, partial [Bacteroidia bacterium]|nr:T9SS type A sorting domain-containing protein [Bacteroidia bacterium]
LMNTLTSGKTYCVSFWYNEGNSTRYAIDKLGIYFSLNGINLTTTSTFTQYNPQITTPPGQFLNDTLNWHQYRTTYTATGNEVYLTLGNFNDSVQTNTQLYPNSSGPYADSYYLFDDISIIPTDLPAVAGKDTSVCKYDSVYIGRPKEIGLDNIWTEITTHTQVGVGAGIWLKSDTSATYVVTQNLCGTITTDTIRVVVNCEVGIGNFINEYGIKIYPNPVNDFITIESRQLKAEITLCDIIGNEILKVKSVKETKIDVSNLSEGIYFVGIRTRDGFISKKIIIQH